MLRQPQGAARFLYNLLFLTAGSVLGALAAFLFTAYAANQLGEVTFGQFGTVQIFVNSFLIIADMGLMNVAIRDVAQRKDQTSYIAGNLLALKLVYGVVGFAVAVMLGVFLGYEPETQKLIVLFSLSLVFVSVGNAGVAVFNGHEAMGYSAASKPEQCFGICCGDRPFGYRSWVEGCFCRNRGMFLCRSRLQLVHPFLSVLATTAFDL